jgi:type II secretory pathway predicted ATPase ExeA
MYNPYFGFSESAFENTLDQKFLFLSKDQQEGVAALLYFAETKKGLAIVYGDSGTGKSMLINSFLARLPESIQPIIMLNPSVTPLGMLLYVAKALKIRITKNESVLELSDKVKKNLISAKLRGKSFVLIIDEAHLLSNQALEEIRLLSNIETPDKKLLQILLVGQYELSHKVNRPEMRHLRWRIDVERFLSPLNPEETIQYADHRLEQVGSGLSFVLEDNCRSLIFKMTQGSPPHINLLFDDALLICMNEGLRKINRKVLKRAHEAGQTNLVFPLKSSKARTYRAKRSHKSLIITAGSVAVVVLLGITAVGSGLGVDNLQRVLHQVRSVIQTASGPQIPLVAKSEDPVKPKNEFTRVRHSGKPEGAPASSLEISASPPLPSLLAENSGRTEITGKLSFPEKQSSSPPGTRKMKPEASAEPKTIEISNSKESWGKPHRALQEVDGAPAPSPMPTPAQVPSVSSQLIAQAGDSLNRITNRNYPDNKKMGLAALILANPELINDKKIFPGQTLYLPEISFDKETIRLRDKKFYAIYGRYLTSESLNKDTSWLQKKNVHFVLRGTKDSKRNMVYRVFLGGYETEAELEKAFVSVNLKSAKRPKDIGQTNQPASSVKNQAKMVDEEITDKQEVLENSKVADIYLKRGMGNDPIISKFTNKFDLSFNNFSVVSKTYRAAFQKDQNTFIPPSITGVPTALSEVQLEQVNVNTSLPFYKLNSTCKLDNSFNGFTCLGRINQSTGSVNNQTNIVSFDNAK